MSQQIVVFVNPEFAPEDGTHFDAVVSALDHFEIPSHVFQAGDDNDYVVVPRDQLAMLVKMSNSHIEDIQTGVQDGTYDAEDNLDIDDKLAAVGVIEKIMGIDTQVPETMKQVDIGDGRIVLRVTEPDAPGLYADITNCDGAVPSSPESELLVFGIYPEKDRFECLFQAEIHGRSGLNDWYEENVGYRPDDDAGKPLPILKLVDLVAGMLLLTKRQPQGEHS